MEIKHTHPKYTTDDQRMEKLKDTRAVCLAAIGQLRAKPAKQSQTVRAA